ncbi:MAG: LuxR C-terminal-related transcriptional regulator [Pseudomonadota bacterium]
MVDHDNITPWLLRSKVIPPRQLNKVIERQELLARLDDGARGSLIILEAPGGYGKSNLLSQWRARRTQRDDTVCWLSVDEADDAQTFLAYLSFAAHVGGIDASSTGLMNFEFTTEKSLAQMIYQLLALLERHERPVRMVIDDFERLDDAVVEATMPLLLRRLPSNVTLVIASREPVGIRTVDFEHRGLVMRLGPQHLGFVREEIAELWGARLTTRQIAKLEAQTEGWPVLVCMLLTAYDMSAFDIRHLEEVSYNDQSIMTYFEQKILMRLPSSMREFLRLCSVLDDVNDDVVEHVLEWPDPAEALNVLSSLEAFASPIAGQKVGYRLHPMMREYLRHKLRDEDPDTYLALHRRLAAYFSRTGNHVNAVRSALECDDRDVVLETLEATRAVVLWMQEGLVEYRVIDQYLDEETVLSSPTAGLMRVLILMKKGRQSEAGELYGKVATAHADRIADDKTLFASAFACRILLSTYRGLYVASDDIVAFQKSLDELTEANGTFLGFILTIKCLTLHQRGRFSESIQYGKQAISALRDVSSVYGEFFIQLHLSMIAEITSTKEELHTDFRRVSHIVRTSLCYDDGVRVLYEILKKESEHERVPLDQSGLERLNNTAIKLLKKEGWIDIYAAAVRTLSEKLFIVGSHDEALITIETFAQFADRNDMIYLRDICHAQRALLLAWSDDVEAASAALGDITPYCSDSAQYLERAPWRAGEAIGEVELALARFGSRESTVDQWRAYRDTHGALGNARLSGRFSALLAMVNKKDPTTDLKILADVLSSGFDRSIALYEAPLQQVCEADASPASAVILARLRELRAQRQGQFSTHHGAGLFSEKEVTVIRELSTGMSDKEIALVIGMTEHGVRYHLKKIYQKLSVRSRTEAVDKARRMDGLLP